MNYDLLSRKLSIRAKRTIASLGFASLLGLSLIGPSTPEASAQVPLQPQTINWTPGWGAFGPRYEGDVTFTLSSTTTSGLPVTYCVSQSNKQWGYFSGTPGLACAVGQGPTNSASFTYTGPDIYTITASQAGDATYAAATPVTNTLFIRLGVAGFILNLPPNGYTYTGSPIAADPLVSFPDGSTNAPPSHVVVTYDGSLTPPTNVGGYKIIANSGLDPSKFQIFPDGGILVGGMSIGPAATALNLTDSNSTSVFGSNVIYTATLSSTAGIPTGTVDFFDGNVRLGTATADSRGVAALSTSSLGVGNHVITASHTVQGNFGPSTSNAVQQVVTLASTTTVLTTSAASTFAGASVTLTATVSSPSVTPPSGSVSFYDGPTLLFTAPLNSSGVASYTSSSFAVGPHVITAQYAGNGNFSASTSPAVQQTVTIAPTTTVLSTSSTSTVTGAPATFTATVTSPFATPTGSVGFYDGNTLLATNALNNNGVATFTISSLAVGTHTIAAQYLGDVNFAASSATVQQTVTAGLTKTALTASAIYTVPAAPVTFTASVSSTAGTPTGNVNFFDANTLLATVTLSSGQSTLTTSALGVGSHTVTAFYAGDGSFTPSVSSPVTVIIGSGLQFIPVAPCRIADTRTAVGAFGGPAISGGTSRDFMIPLSACGIPASAQAYSLNVTVVPDATLGYLSVWPSGAAKPFVSTLNSDGRVKANAAIVPAGTNGAISVFAYDTTNVVLDINGYFVPAGTANALAFYPLTPCRVADTRLPAGPLAGPSLSGGQARVFPIQSSSCNIPANAQAYSLNYTAVPHGALGYLATWPTGQAQPFVSTLNAPTAQVTANAAIVPAGSQGNISVFATNDTDVILDVNGYFAPPAAGGLSLYTITPCRALDTRNTLASPFNGTLSVNIEGSGCGAPPLAQGYVLNGTVVPPGPLYYLTLWPEGQGQPFVSTLNANDGVVTSNMAIVPTTSGYVDAFAANPTHLVLDLSGYFAP